MDSYGLMTYLFEIKEPPPMTRFRGEYTEDWPEVARRAKDSVNWCCVRCGHPHEPKAGYTLTCHHLDGNKSNNAWWNVCVLDQRCHLSIQGRVILERPWMFEHSPWFLPYLAGWSAWHYLGLELSRDEVMANLDYYAGLQKWMLEGTP